MKSYIGHKVKMIGDRADICGIVIKDTGRWVTFKCECGCESSVPILKTGVEILESAPKGHELTNIFK